MKKLILFCWMLLVLPISAQGVTEEQSQDIQKLLDEACRVSKTPGASVVVRENGETSYYYSGYADLNSKTEVNEQTLFELASVSKSFTGLAILLLEEEGKLSLNDAIIDYLPDLRFKLNGTEIDMKKVTIRHFLYHTSGLTNEDHGYKISEVEENKSLTQTLDHLSGSELSFEPGEKFQYGTMNYDVLGRVIEVVASQSYSDFMKTQMFNPLKFNETYSVRNEAQYTGELATGYKAYFAQVKPSDAPEIIGNRPAGYMISSSHDMNRWLMIQMNQVEDIPAIFKEIIRKSHQGDDSVAAFNQNRYAAGWFVSENGKEMNHPGGNPNFVSKVKISTKKNQGLSLLANSNTMNPNLLNQVEEILNGEKTSNYQKSTNQRLDNIGTFLTFGGLLASFYLIRLVSRKKYHLKQLSHTKSKVRFYLALISLFVLLVILMSIASDWATFSLWQPISLLTAVISGVIFTFLLVVYFHVPHKSN
ncbi:serine hydrolase domain-containing protein [Vagococcus hydrophili]|uniref:Beta-lactamase family protein n=1 Tax=Vagococcus hydrophili TaxID=2714947 RepID=A0A6G8AV77_9ENTE|nr:serine hydrolase domain-containing protein [Vagococcus hydrophili]QIL48890.1 beta-lactamase family protein [Vagococcus hydrophili]